MSRPSKISLPSRRSALVGLIAGLPTVGQAATGAIEDLEARLSGRIGITAIDTGSNRRFQHRSGERFAMCSTFKMALAAAVLQRAESGRIDLDERLSFDSAKVLPTSPVTGASREGSLPVRALCAAAVSYSDNTAANLLIEKLGGPPAVTAFFRTIGDQDSRLDRMELALNENRPNDPRDTTTPAAMANVVRAVLLGDRVLRRRGSRDALRDWMLDERNGARRVRAAAPAGSQVANKPGTSGNGAVNDIAIIWPAAGAPIVISVYTQTPGGAISEGERAIGDAVRIALRHLGRA